MHNESHIFDIFIFPNLFYKTASIASFNLEWGKGWKSDFHALFPPLLKSGFVTCGFWGCHLWPLTLSFVASEALICHKWEAQSIALTTEKHRFGRVKKCKKIGKDWLSTTCKNVDFLRFFGQSPVRSKQWPVFKGQNSELILQIHLLSPPKRSVKKTFWVGY